MGSSPHAGKTAIGVAGFEPAASRTQTVRSTRLSYTPMWRVYGQDSRRLSIQPSIRARHGDPEAACRRAGERQEGPVRRAAEADPQELPKETQSALGKEAAAVRRGDSPTRKELDHEARRLGISGRSKMGKDELKRAVANAR